MSTPRIKVTIDALVLRGFAPEQRQALTAGLQAELGRLLADRQTAAAFGNSRSVESLPDGRLRVAAGTSPQRIGSLAARHIVREVTR
mgnify:FL=1